MITASQRAWGCMRICRLQVVSLSLGVRRGTPRGIRHRASFQELPALLVAILGFPCVELTTVALGILRRMSVYTVRPVCWVLSSCTTFAGALLAAQIKLPSNPPTGLCCRRHGAASQQLAHLDVCWRTWRQAHLFACKFPPCAC